VAYVSRDIYSIRQICLYRLVRIAPFRRSESFSYAFARARMRSITSTTLWCISIVLALCVSSWCVVIECVMLAARDSYLLRYVIILCV